MKNGGVLSTIGILSGNPAIPFELDKAKIIAWE